MPFHPSRTTQRDRFADRDMLAETLRGAWQRDKLFDEFGSDLTEQLCGRTGNRLRKREMTDIFCLAKIAIAMQFLQ